MWGGERLIDYSLSGKDLMITVNRNCSASQDNSFCKTIKKNQNPKPKPTERKTLNAAQPGKQRREHRLQDAWSHLSTAVNSLHGPSWQSKGDVPSEICRAIVFLQKAQVRPHCSPGEQEKSLKQTAVQFLSAQLAVPFTTEVAKRMQLGVARPGLLHSWWGGHLATLTVSSKENTWNYRCHPTQDSFHGSGNKAVCQEWHAPAGHCNSCQAKKELWKAKLWALFYLLFGLSTDPISSKVTGQSLLLWDLLYKAVKRRCGSFSYLVSALVSSSPAPSSISLGSAGRVVNRSRSGCASYSIFAPKEVRCLGNQKGPFSSWKRSISTFLTRLYPVKFSNSAHTLHKVTLAFQKPI